MNYINPIQYLHSLGYSGQGMSIGHLDTGINTKNPLLSSTKVIFRHIHPDGYSIEATEPFDSSDHGTSTASIIAGQNDGKNFTGIAPDAQIYSGAVIEEGNILSRIMLGLDWIVDTPISVLNLSLGIPQDNPVFKSLIRKCNKRDILVVAPIGNRGAGKGYCPGIYPEVLSVGSHSPDGSVCRFSGSINDPTTTAVIKPDIIAPGEEFLMPAKNDGSNSLQGTSISCAYVAGIALLLRQAFPCLTAQDISNALCVTAKKVNDSQIHRTQNGPVDIQAAFAHLTQIKQPSNNVETNPHSSINQFIDQRFFNFLQTASKDQFIDVILEFTDFSSRDEAIELLSLPTFVNKEFKYQALTNTPSCILRTQAHKIQKILDLPTLSLISAVDVDKFSYYSFTG